MITFFAAALTLGVLSQPKVVNRADDLPFALPAAVAEDRQRLADAVKAASRCGEKGRPSVADFDAAINFSWSRKAGQLYILPLDLEDALRRHDAAHPDARLGGPPLGVAGATFL